MTIATTEDTEDTEVQMPSLTFLRVLRVLRGPPFQKACPILKWIRQRRASGWPFTISPGIGFS